MATVLSRRLTEMTGYDYLGVSTIWDYYHSDFSRARNLKIFCKKKFDSNPEIKKIAVRVGAKGRSGHSATSIHFFDVTKFIHDYKSAITINR